MTINQMNLDSYTYHQLLKHLYFEGYADSYEEADILFEEMDENQLNELFDELYEKVVSGYNPPNISRMMQKVHTLGARSGAAHTKMRELERTPRGFRTITGSREKAARLKDLRDKSVHRSATITSVAGLHDPNYVQGIAAANRRRAKSNIRPFQREDYEYLIHYLLDEGYADDINSAEKIIESMSLDWLNGILNESGSLSDMFKSASDNAYAADMEAHKKAMASIERMKQLFRDAGHDVDSKPETRPSSSNERMTPQQRAAKMKEKIDKAMEVMDKQDRQHRRN